MNGVVTYSLDVISRLYLWVCVKKGENIYYPHKHFLHPIVEVWREQINYDFNCNFQPY